MTLSPGHTGNTSHHHLDFTTSFPANHFRLLAALKNPMAMNTLRLDQTHKAHTVVIRPLPACSPEKRSRPEHRTAMGSGQG